MGKSVIKVILCDDHALIRRGIRDTLSDAPDIQVIGEAGDYGELRSLMRNAVCDVLVLDNTRFLHGRRAIADAAQRTIATFFGYVRFAVPDTEELPQAPWRQGDFRPPLPPVRG